MQETPDTPEALTCAPSLRPQDVPKRASTVPSDVTQIQLAPYHRRFLLIKTSELTSRSPVQETPDTPEALTCVPSLHLADIPKRASTVPSDVTQISGVTVLQHDLFTNDVLYAEAALDMHPVPAQLLPLVPLFCRCACRCHHAAVQATLHQLLCPCI